MALRAEDRDFFAAVADIIFTNPFDDASEAIRALVPDAGRPARGRGRHPFEALVPAVDSRLADIERQGIARVDALEGRDREIVEYVWLFRLYHDCVDDFDRLIIEQLAAGDEPIEAPFTEQVHAELLRRGFPEAEASRYVALFHQLRRAYYFIEESLVGSSPSMGRLRHALWNNIFTADVRRYGRHLWDRMEDFSTLLIGETGSGKGSAAAAIGRSGFIPYDRRARRFAASFTGTFIATNLSQFPESLIESELFGHRKGAFTGAIDNHRGLFERSSVHGALFLDEIGDVSAPVQIKLLNVIQDRRFSPVGSHERLRFDGRVIAASNRPVEELRARGFRDDFLYRLCSDVIEVPPLRQRIRESPAELDELLALLVRRTAGHDDRELVASVSQAIATLPRDYPWPGNVRELEQAVRRILLSGRYQGAAGTAVASGADDLADDIREGRLTAAELLGRYCRLLHERFGSYEAVARHAALDRRTAKKHIEREAE